VLSLLCIATSVCKKGKRKEHRAFYPCGGILKGNAMATLSSATPVHFSDYFDFHKSDVYDIRFPDFNHNGYDSNPTLFIIDSTSLSYTYRQLKWRKWIRLNILMPNILKMLQKKHLACRIRYIYQCSSIKSD
jgi:hypothetical protein